MSGWWATCGILRFGSYRWANSSPPSLHRFAGYPERYSAALDRVDRGERAWVAQPTIESCHTVWMELHEDLLATLGLERGS